jgi:hypothetical protein
MILDENKIAEEVALDDQRNHIESERMYFRIFYFSKK